MKKINLFYEVLFKKKNYKSISIDYYTYTIDTINLLKYTFPI